jgi:hypothetical protein
MKEHPFIFCAGHWEGEGKITMNMLMEELPFKTSWSVQGKDFAGKVTCAQDFRFTAQAGVGEGGMRNELCFYDFSHDTFTVRMENENVVQIVGTGVYDEKRIAWEFLNNDMEFQGFEVYTLQSDGTYEMHGEYVTSDPELAAPGQLRSKIEAIIRPKIKQLEFDSKDSSGPF